MISIKTLQNNCVPFGVYFIVLNFNYVSLIYNPACWDLNVVPFTISSGFSVFQYNYIMQQIAKINKNTCIIWVDMDKSVLLQNLTSFVSFERGANSVCRTALLYPLRAIITLADECFEGRHVLHEMLHALGFRHEQQRVDRDCYVLVSESARNHYNYRISPMPNLDTFPYDKESIMHYTRTSELKALSERFYEWEPLGQEEAILSDLDLWKIQYKFCGRPHYCEVYPEHCILMEKMESEKNCVVKT